MVESSENTQNHDCDQQNSINNSNPNPWEIPKLENTPSCNQVVCSKEGNKSEFFSILNSNIYSDDITDPYLKMSLFPQQAPSAVCWRDHWEEDAHHLEAQNRNNQSKIKISFLSKRQIMTSSETVDSSNKKRRYKILNS